MQIKDNVFIITGASSGIGLSAAKLLTIRLNSLLILFCEQLKMGKRRFSLMNNYDISLEPNRERVFLQKAIPDLLKSK
jgi:NAD(P)-dependent dehydrogenase (short-subunit alcohol dehydrogenase family)